MDDNNLYSNPAEETVVAHSEPQDPPKEDNGTFSQPAYSYTPNNGYGYTPAPQSPKPPKKDKHLFGLGTVIVCIVLSVIISTALSLTIVLGSAGERDKDTAGVSSSQSGEASDLVSSENGSDSSSGSANSTITIDGNVESLVEAVYEKASVSCVGIRTKAWVESFFGGSTESTGSGSGVIYTADGYIVTNYHVISEAVSDYSNNSTIEVFLMSDPDEPVDAKVVGYNKSADLAVIKIEKTGLTPVEIADSDEIKVGQYAVAIGSPGGIEFLNSVSSGTVSGPNRTITVDSIGEMEVIQTDAAINPGNSGGALLNSKGQLIGITSSKLVSESYENMGFAIPSNVMLEVVTEIIQNKDKSPYIGIVIYKYDSEYLAQYSLPSGAAVESVVKNAPAYNAGIKAGDIITNFNGKEIEEYTDFIDELNKCTPGTKVTARIYRNSQHRYYSLTIEIGSNNSHG